MCSQRVLDVDVAPELLDLSLTDLPLRMMTRRALMLAGVSTLNDLVGVPPHGLRHLIEQNPDIVAEMRSALATVVVPAGGTFELLKRAPLERLAIGPRLAAALRDAGCDSVAHVLTAPRERLAHAVGLGRANALRRNVRRIAALPAERLRSVTWHAAGHTFALPRLDPAILRAVALAESAEEEIYGLVLGPSVRDSLLLLRRWGLLSWPQPTLEALATAEGLTSERVRQIVARHEAMLSDSGLRLPKAEAAFALWAEVDASLHLDEVVRHARGRNVDLTVPVLRTLPTLARMGLIRPGFGWSRPAGSARR